MRNADLEAYISQSTKLQSDIGELLHDLQGKTPQEKRHISKTIDSKFKQANDLVVSMDIEIVEMEMNPKLEAAAESYREKYNYHKNSLSQLQDQYVAISQTGTEPETGQQMQYTGVQINEMAERLQQRQIDELDDAITKGGQIIETGGRTIEEIQRQKDVMESISTDLTEMDSELERAKKILSNMRARFAGDTCVKVLIVLVGLVIIALIFCEIFAPGSIQKHANDWFDVATNSSDTNST